MRPRRMSVCSWGVGAWLVIAALALVAAPRPAAAQVVGGSISGTVTDDTGGALPGVTVTVTNKINGASQVLITGEGNYRAVALQPAPYAIAVELSGFADAKREIVLTIGADRPSTSGSASRRCPRRSPSRRDPLVEVAKSQPSSVIVAEQVAALPVLAQLPHARAADAGRDAEHRRSRSSPSSSSAASADQRNGYTTIIDGGDIDDATWGNPTINIPQDAVQEFKVFRNQFGAEYGVGARRGGVGRHQVGRQQPAAAPGTTSAATRR